MNDSGMRSRHVGSNGFTGIVTRGMAFGERKGLRGRHFYTMLQDLRDSPFRGIKLLSREEIDAVLKVLKKEDSSVTAKIQGTSPFPGSPMAPF